MSPLVKPFATQRLSEQESRLSRQRKIDQFIEAKHVEFREE